MKHAALAVVLALLCTPALRAQQACPMEMLKDPKPPLAEIYAKALATAKAWHADVVPARVGNTTLGPLAPQGRSEAWNLMFYSAAAKANLSITTFRGMFNCYAMEELHGKVPDFKPDFFRDGAKLYALAKQHGAALIDQGFGVSIDTAYAPSNRHAMWYINFSKQSGPNGKLSIILDANTGAVEQVQRN